MNTWSSLILHRKNPRQKIQNTDRVQTNGHRFQRWLIDFKGGCHTFIHLEPTEVDHHFLFFVTQHTPTCWRESKKHIGQRKRMTVSLNATANLVCGPNLVVFLINVFVALFLLYIDWFARWQAKTGMKSRRRQLAGQLTDAEIDGFQNLFNEEWRRKIVLLPATNIFGATKKTHR